jgi:hypothetical protein
MVVRLRATKEGTDLVRIWFIDMLEANSTINEQLRILLFRDRVPIAIIFRNGLTEWSSRLN